MFDVDYVFPWVNSNDPQWINSISKYTKIDTNDNVRFRDLGLVKYSILSVEKYAPWIKNIVILISSKSQITEELLNLSPKIKFITHEEFIPKEYLPCFNSCAIEMFLHNIPNISEHFIYGNDDFYFRNLTSVDDFFTKEGKPIVHCTNIAEPYHTNFYKQIGRTIGTIREYLNSLNLTEKLLQPYKINHYQTPMCLTQNKQCFEVFKDKMLDSLTMFRSLNDNYNQYIYQYYGLEISNSYENNLLKKDETDNFGLYINPKRNFNDLYDTKCKVMCVNDGDNVGRQLLTKFGDEFEKIIKG